MHTVVAFPEVIEAAVRYDPSLPHNDHMIDDFLDVAENVRANDYSAILVLYDLEQQVEEIRACHRVKSGGGLIEYQEFRVEAYGQQDCEFLPLARRERSYACFRGDFVVSYVGLFQLAVPVGVIGGDVPYELPYRHPVKQLSFLVNVAYACQLGWAESGGVAAESDAGSGIGKV
jgi:hypothetical protein